MMNTGALTPEEFIEIKFPASARAPASDHPQDASMRSNALVLGQVHFQILVYGITLVLYI